MQKYNSVIKMAIDTAASWQAVLRSFDEAVDIHHSQDRGGREALCAQVRRTGLLHQAGELGRKSS
jgi:hypothetical protein